MKAFVWLIVFALAIEAFACWGVAGLLARSFSDTQRFAPAFTDLVMSHRGWFYCVPVLCGLGAGFLTLRRELQIGTVFCFAGVVAVSASVVFGITFIATVLPLLTFKS